MSDPIQPVFILPEDTKRETGKSAQRNNILAAIAVADTVRSTLGPKGMDKMLVDSAGDVTVTNDGVTILKEMQVEHPAAKMVVEVAKTQEEAVGDGTTTAVIVAGELLKQAENLLDQGVHPAVLAKGYRLAEEKAQIFLSELGKPVTINDNAMLQRIVVTAMTGKGAEARKDELAPLLVRAVQHVGALDGIKVESVVGNSGSELVEGIVLDKERVHPEMPKIVEEGKIALLNCPLEIRNTEIDAKIQITDPSQLTAFLDQEEKSLKEMVDSVVSSGCSVVLCQKGVDELAQHYFSKKGVMVVRRVRKSDMEKLAKATGGKIINNWKDLSLEDLGKARVRETNVGDEPMIFVEKCLHPKAVTLLIRGSTEHVAAELKRAVEDSLGDLVASLDSGKIVAGAGSVEVLVSRKLVEYARTLPGREQLAVEAFARTLEIIPRTLAANAGLDAIKLLTEVRVSSFNWPGIDVFSGSCIDAWTAGIVEPLKIKTQALSSATQVAEMILRIDDVILAGKGS